jgi:hypothetical protein
MTNLDKRNAALQLLRRTAIRPGNFQPPALRLLWRMGVDARPPHFCSFLHNALFSGALYGVVWGGVMWLTLWQDSLPPLRAAGIALLAGAGFGLAMAAYYGYGKRVHALPSWDALDAGPAAADAPMLYTPQPR